MAKRRKKRTSIRTAAGTVQDQFITRMGKLHDDATQVLPIQIGSEPKSMAHIRKRVDAMAAKGKGGFFDKRDKGVIGAVAHALPLATLQTVPRIADRRIGGKRRFFLQRGHVAQVCSVGVQNFDDHFALLTAYRILAKTDNLHFFAGPKLWCTGSEPSPPEEWLHALTSCELKPETGWYGCGHEDISRVLLGFRGGPSIAICGHCAKPDKNLHSVISLGYAGPRQRQPVTVQRLTSEGVIEDLPSDAVAEYRAGVRNESKLVKA
jgi:hypothetical protein